MLKGESKKVEDKKAQVSIPAEILEQYEVITGESLKTFVSITQGTKKRLAIKKVLNYVKNDKDLSNYVIAISGLRGTGKTFGMKQVIVELQDFDNCVYITVKKDDATIENLMQLLDKMQDKKYIFIDEVTLINKFSKSSSFLYDVYCSMGKKVVIGGIVIDLVENVGLYHRTLHIDMTYLPYIDAKNTMGKNFIQYMYSGGFYAEDWQKVNANILTNLALEEKLDVTKKQHIQVLESLRHIGLVQEIDNYADIRDKHYYVTSPIIANQLLLCVLRLMHTISELQPEYRMTSRDGVLIENIVAIHLQKYAQMKGYALKFYHNYETGAEIDLIVEKSDRFKTLIEVKLTKDKDTAIIKSLWLNRLFEEDEDIVDRFVVYGGKTCIFEKFDSKDIYAPKGYDVFEIEQRNKGTQLINCEEFVLNVDKYMKKMNDYDLAWNEE